MNGNLILIVEDNPDHLELTVLTLEDLGVKALKRSTSFMARASMPGATPKESPTSSCST